MKNKHIILDELKQLLHNHILWSVWDEENYTPVKKNFTSMSTTSILDRLDKLQKLPNKHNQLLTLYRLLLYNETIDKNIKDAPKTY